MHYKLILTAYCLQSADSQHSHCCCCPTNTLTAVHHTNSTTFVSPSAELKLFVLVLHWTLRYQFDISKTCCLIQGNYLEIYETHASKLLTKSQTLTSAHTTKYLYPCSPQHINCPSKHHQHTIWLMSYCWLTCANFHHCHHCKSLQIDQLKHQQVKFPICYWI